MQNAAATLHFLRDLFIYFLERGREKERERNISVSLPLMHPLLGTWLATQACTLMGNWTGDPLVHKPTLNPLSYTNQGTTSQFCLFDLFYFSEII